MQIEIVFYTEHRCFDNGEDDYGITGYDDDDMQRIVNVCATG